ncbi:hypothetical protein [Chenggangzhangella methanolivorans]|uniref:Uncharacterized protein n=1 Tax=Chenggangzhangella methanolivorans TaxID=1437009 RepID=A0A9E6RB63_9HYPH|nr:hypothetical protein [Chenggangzhangella methanolivorans]QZO01135.1 hypothetical protein K6K41_06160 [Chenggangzhangella methanolivorans]
MMSSADCLALFVTPVLTESASALALARSAIEEFVASYAHAPTGALAALHELEAAWIERNLDGATADSILADIRLRISTAGI